MTRITRMATLIAGSCLALAPLATPALAQSQAEDQRFQQAQDRFNNELNIFRDAFDRYQQARARGYNGPRGPYNGGPQYNSAPPYDPRYDDRDESGYDASRYYRSGGSYQERVLTSDDRVYRGSDGQYYCKRNDGTTGLIVGAVGGGVLGNVIAGGHSKGVGTILGALAGGVIGKQVDQNGQQVKCR